MKTVLEINKTKVPLVRIDKSLNKYDKMLLFPEKVAKAKKAFEKPGLPDPTKYSH
jgi:hypothetical protein